MYYLFTARVGGLFFLAMSLTIEYSFDRRPRAQLVQNRKTLHMASFLDASSKNPDPYV
jgi:hypothetical protein